MKKTLFIYCFVILMAFSLLHGCVQQAPETVPVHPKATPMIPDVVVTPPPCPLPAPPGYEESEEAPEETPKPTEKKPVLGTFGAFTAEDLDGNTFTQDMFSQSKLTMVNIWGTFCPPCLQEMPFLGELSEEYAGKGLTILGIVTDVMDRQGKADPGQIALAKEIIAKTGADYTHLIPSDSLNDVKLRYVQYIPETVFVDQNGDVVGKPIVGGNDKESWIEIIDAHLKAVGA